MASASPTRLIICAHEFGLSAGICHAILDLIDMRRVSAVAVLATGTQWRVQGPALMAQHDAAGIGLMLEPGCARSPLAAVSYLLRTPRAELARDFARQIAAFHDVAGRAPDFITGRFGFHSWPMGRGALFLALERLQIAGLWLCDPTERAGAIMRRGRAKWQAGAASALATGFRHQASRRGYPVNRGFSGFVQNTKTYPVWHDFERFCQYPGPAPMVTCRPGYPDDAHAPDDPLADRRMRELMYLSSTRFADMLDLLTLRLVRDPRETI
ncbi:MAG: hypothetical protein HLUCCO17_06680 [Saliniramus fredricksonii]|uniref:Uncharacterized protein n=1 Tax=Saliniramus fredricksonii TaxID=1653334 RepID=A0A0P7XV03_9HYPH|nr:ChbG/HpnK family deacetylase [Saliniramus fredricksonii]KPQ11315.1 MAG: hypothetical protein HLUCCO17_06680 [Saliniramus fredricksonii]SCC82035.1 hypothetical protein GA0071312_3009 [Saliniramus fredricksonii]